MSNECEWKPELHDGKKCPFHDNVYHGTNAEFDKYDIEKSSYGTLGKGIYFTNSKEDAKDYGKIIKENKIHPNKVLDIYSEDELIDFGKKMGADISKEIKDPYYQSMIKNKSQKIGQYIYSDLIQKDDSLNYEDALKKAGIDAVIGEGEIMVINPDIIEYESDDDKMKRVFGI